MFNIQFSSFIFCELRNSHMECGNSLPPLMTGFIPSNKCREINFAKQGGDESPHSMERCHARKSKIHSSACSDYLDFDIRNSNVRLFDCSEVPAIAG